MMVRKGQSKLRASTVNQSLDFCFTLLPIQSPISLFSWKTETQKGLSNLLSVTWLPSGQDSYQAWGQSPYHWEEDCSC